MRPDLDIVAALVGSGVRVLDLGCGDGALLEHLIVRQDCAGHGVERSAEGFHACVGRGVPVTQAEIEAELPELDAGSFDCAVLSLTLQATRRPARVLDQMRRVAPRRIVSLPNFGHWRHRLDLAARGRMPVSRTLPYAWHETPNIHLCSLDDFERLAAEGGQRVSRRVLLAEHGRAAPRLARARPNLLAVGAVYLLQDE
ncbi:MAG: methionine biosynthesis protein MetW [Solirubrobacterales bacterium]|jgi:methionine biosynthesis protein MetW|nr:methionine biosynthesis protein MetW [Solirubrobacterales bacterium]